ncbi:hypothetical protein GCM10027346_17740 [Hymenobacter seoulensis]
MEDIDVSTLASGGSDFIDEVTFNAYTLGGTLYQLQAADVALGSNGSNTFVTGTNTIKGIGVNSGPAGTVVLTYPATVAISRLEIIYKNTQAYTAGNLRLQTIGIPSMVWCAEVDLATTLTGPARAVAGQPVDYVATTKNQGDISAAGVVSTVQLTAGLTNVTINGVAAGAAYDSNTGLLTLPAIGTLASNATSTSTIRFTMPATGPVTGVASSTTTGLDIEPVNNNGTLANAKVSTVVNTPPVPAAKSTSTPRGSYTALLPLSATDADNDAITSYTITQASLTALSASGKLYVLVGGNYIEVNTTNFPGLSLTPAQAAALYFMPATTAALGSVNFTYTATDALGEVSKSAATYTLTITNAAPVATNTTNSGSISSSADQTAISALSATDVDGTIASYKISSLPTDGTLYYNAGYDYVAFTSSNIGTVTLTPAQAGSLRFDPSGSTNGNVTFTFTATDNDGAADATPATYTIPVGNVAPTAISSVSNVILPSGNGALTYLVTPSFQGSDADGTVTSYRLTSLPNSSTEGTLYYRTAGSTANVLVTTTTDIPADGTLRFDPANNNDSFILSLPFTAKDNNNATSTNTATLTIPVNTTLPVANDITNATILSSAARTGISTLSASITTGSIYSYIFSTIPDPVTQGTLYRTFAGVTSAVTAGSEFTTGTLGTLGVLSFDPIGTNTTDVTFTYTARANTAVGLTDPTPATYTIPIGNVAPVATATSATMPSSNGSTAILVPSATDADGTIARYTLSGLPAYTLGTLYVGTTVVNTTNFPGLVLTLAEARDLKFDPAGTSNGTFVFNFTATDNDGGISSPAVAYTITVTNVAPSATDVSIQVASAILSTNGQTSIPTLAATDEDGTIASYQFTSLPTKGTLYYNTNTNGTAGSYVAVTAANLLGGSSQLNLSTAQAGTLKYDPSGNFPTADNSVENDSFRFTATDNNGGIDATPATYTIPVKENDTEAVYSTPNTFANTALTNGSVVATVSDANGNITSATLASGSTLPTFLTLQANGTIGVNANAVTAGTYTATINTVDVLGGESAVPVTITINTDKQAVYSSPNTFNRDALSNGTSLATVSDADGTLTSSTIATGTLPTGIGFNTTTGQFTVNSTTAPAASTYSFTVNTVDALGGKSTVTASITITTDQEAVYSSSNSFNTDALTANKTLASVTDADGLLTSATIATGALPANMGFNTTTGQFYSIGGTPATRPANGTYAFTVNTVDATGGKSTVSVSITILADQEAVYTVAAAKNVDNYANGFTLASVTDGDGSITAASLTTGTLPVGTTLAANGSISVTNASALVAGSYPLTISTTDITGGLSSSTITLVINPDAEAVYSTSNSFNRDALSNGSSLATVSDANGALTSATITMGTLPAGIGFNTTTGQFSVNSATAPAAGTYDFTVNTVDVTGGKSSVTATITIFADQEAVYTVAPAKNVDSYVNTNVLASVTDGNGNITAASLTSGTLPAGTTLATNGTITVTNAGTLVAGSYPLTISTTDATAGTSSSTITLVINADREAVASSPNSFNRDGLTNGKTLATVTDADGTITATSPNLPTWLSLASNGTITVPTASAAVTGTTTFTVNTVDALGGKSTVTVSITIFADQEAVASTPNAYNLDALTNGRSLVTITDQNGVITAAVGTGVPTWLTVGADGTISVPTASAAVKGQYSFTVNTTDATSGTSSVAVALNVFETEAVYNVASPTNGPYANGYSFATVSDVDGAVVRAVLSNSNLPSGIDMNAATGQFTVANRLLLKNGTYPMDVVTTDATGGVTTSRVTIIIGAYPLPVTLVSFSAKAANQDAKLTWRTAQELNNDRFVVERSFDAVTFQAIGEVKGQGTTTQAKDYSFVDANVGTKAQGAVYYRLRQMDTDGTPTLSMVQAVAFAKAVANVELYPNPASDLSDVRLDLSTLPAGTYRVQLTDMAGRMVRSTTQQGGLNQALEVKGLPQGSYIVTIQGNGQVFTKRLVKE